MSSLLDDTESVNAAVDWINHRNQHPHSTTGYTTAKRLLEYLAAIAGTDDLASEPPDPVVCAFNAGHDAADADRLETENTGLRTAHIPNQSMPRQDSLLDQMRSVHNLANANGCYDAADHIASMLSLIHI